MKYRREIDGLRTIAVLPVILFHAGVSLFSGGFVGVDVFFVISGYLITTIIASEIEAQRFSVLRFYERRARRILPALFFILAITFPFAWYFLAPSQFADFRAAVIAVLFFSSNVLFWSNTDYFAPAAEENPLLHTWSLAVEEQFYIFFPLVLMLAAKLRGRWVFHVVLLMTGLSFMAAELMTKSHPPASFYLLPSRAWELGVGCLCGLYLLRRKRCRSTFLTLLGVSAIVASVLLYDDSTPFPSVYALAPVLGTALVILFGVSEGPVGWLLSNRLMVAVGLISYSAYLWHQPVFAIARIGNAGEPSMPTMLGLALMSMVLAALSWRFVEMPFRSRRHRIWGSGRAIVGFSFGGAAVLLLSALLVHNTQSYLGRLTPEQAYYLGFLDYRETEDYVRQFRKGQCFYGASESGFDVYDQENCLELDPARKNVLLIGDSHAAHLWRALDDELESVNVIQANASGCRPLLPLEGETRCTDLARFIFKDFLPKHKVDVVILSGRWQDIDVPKIGKTVQELKKFVKSVVILGPTAEYGAALPVVLSRSEASIRTDESGFHLLVEERFEMSNLLEEAAVGAGAVFHNVQAAICAGRRCSILSSQGEPLAFDNSHFTMSGARDAVRRLVALAGSESEFLFGHDGAF